MQIANSILNRYLYSNSTKPNISWAVQKFYNYFCWHFTLYRSDVLNCFSYRMKSLCWCIIVTYVQRPKFDSKPVSIGHNEGSYFKCRHRRLCTKNLASLCFPPKTQPPATTLLSVLVSVIPLLVWQWMWSVCKSISTIIAYLHT